MTARKALWVVDLAQRTGCWKIETQRRKGAKTQREWISRRVKKVVRRFPTLDGGLRGKARFTHPTKNMNAKAHNSPAGTQTQRPGGLGQVPRRWLRVKRFFAFGEYRVQLLG
jgi:hypothetical protein